MQKAALIFFLLLSSQQYVSAQTNCRCCTEYHRQFDFWLGEWEVFDSHGKKIGENSIDKIEAGCLVREHWQGTSGSTGRSYNFYDTADSTWNQVWVDNQGNNLQLKGKASAQGMILQSVPKQNSQGQWLWNRITWIHQPDGTVSQLWEILDKNQKLKQVAFKGIYKRKPE